MKKNEKKISKGFENCKIWVVMLSVFLLSSILGSQVMAGWQDTTGAVYYLGGNVGIGTMMPGRALEIKNADPVIKLNIDGGTVDKSVYEVRGIGVTGVEGLEFRTVNNATTVFNTLMFLKQNGNVGIGTTNPGDARLAVRGKIKATEVVVLADNPTNWPDHVFKADYNLMKLDELENNIKENGHLPEIPSASEVAKDGVNVGEMQAKLLQKVEELTLYAIEQNKEISMLKKELAAVKQGK